jgi:DNA repair exonuclease SbcCD ATPase subunit
MITLKQLKLHNFLSHSDTTIDFEPEQKILIDGISGSGKSAIVDALIWVLYGIGRSNNRFLIKNGKTISYVQVLLAETSKPNHYFLIRRLISTKGKHDLDIIEYVDKVAIPIKVVGIKGKQEYLEKQILHSSYLLFINSIVYPQENSNNFVKQSANKRKDIILEMIDTQNFEEYLKKAKALYSEINNQISNNNGKIDFMRDYIKENKSILNKVDDYKQQGKELLEKISKLEDKVVISIDLTEIQIELNDKLAKKVEIDDINVKELQEHYNQIMRSKASNDILVAEWSSYYKDVAGMSNKRVIEKDYSATITLLKEELIQENVRSVPVCRKCNWPYEEYVAESRAKIAHINNKIAELEQKQSQFIKQEKELEELTLAINQKKPDKQPLDLATFDLDIREYYEKMALVKDLEILTQQIKELDLKKTKIIKELGSEWDHNKEEDNLQRYKIEYNTISRQLTEVENIQNYIDKYNKEIKLYNIKNNELKENLEGMAILKDAFGPNGIKAVIIDYLIPRLEDKINNILSQLSDFRVKLETQRGSLSTDSIIEGLFISIYNELGEELDFDNYSGGEKLSIIIAISEALSEIQNISFRILDELFVGLDEDKTNDFANIIKTLGTRFNQLICISHLRNVKDMFEQKLIINKHNGDSTII